MNWDQPPAICCTAELRLKEREAVQGANQSYCGAQMLATGKEHAFNMRGMSKLKQRINRSVSLLDRVVLCGTTVQISELDG